LVNIKRGFKKNTKSMQALIILFIFFTLTIATPSGPTDATVEYFTDDSCTTSSYSTYRYGNAPTCQSNVEGVYYGKNTCNATHIDIQLFDDDECKVVGPKRVYG
jgi:hypothetical protein